METYECVRNVAIGAGVGVTVTKGLFLGLGLSSIGPVAGGWFATNMGAALISGSAMSSLQAGVMGYGGTYLAGGASVGALYGLSYRKGGDIWASVAGAAALQQQQPIKTPQLAPPSGGKGALRPPSGDFERVDSGGDDSSIDLIGGAPSAALNDSDADFAQIGSGGGLVTTQFEFGGAYNYEVTLEQLMIALGVLSAGGDRVEVKNIYRALTTLGSHEGTGMCGSKRRGKGGEEGWRGMGDDEAKMLIDSFNYPQQVLTTTFEEMSTSSESLVVEYAATLFSQVCDRSTIPPPKVFLGLCSKCKLCCPLKKTTPSINGEQIRGESVSVDRDEDGDGGGERSSLSGSASSTSSGHSSHSSGSLVRVSPDPSRDGENGEGVLDGAGGGGKKMNNKDAKKDDKEEVSRSANEPASSMTISSPAIQVQVSGAALSKEVELQSIPSKREMNESLQPN